MRLAVFAGAVAVWLLSGCAARQGGTGIPDGEAIYDVPLEEVWPSVQQFFTDNKLSFREDKGILTTAIDVTERRRREQTLRALLR